MYSVYGLKLASSLPFPYLLEAPAAAGNAPDLLLRVQAEDSHSLPEEDEPGVLLWRYEAAGRALLSVYERQGSTLFRYHGRAAYFIDPALSEVSSLPRPGLDEEVIRFFFLGLVTAFILHRRGCHNLHAAAVEVDGGAVAFLAPAGGGKSTMAASFVAAGHALLSDDVLPLQVREDGVWVLPGPALLRLWPDSAARVWDDPATLRRHALQTPKRQVWLPMTERFYCGKPLPLRAVYLLERAEESIVRLEPLSQREALLALISSAFGNFLLRGELLSRQMDFFAQIVPTLPFRRLPVPAAFKGLATLYDAVLEDVATTGYRRDGNP